MAQRVAVKVGEGYYTRAVHGAMDMDRADLLHALARDEVWARKLQGVALDECAVKVCASAAKEGPSADEADRARELKGLSTLTDLLAAAGGGGGAPAMGYVFIHVQLPALAGAGGESMRCV